MNRKDLTAALRRMAAETGSLPCLGCGHEHSCGVHGCAVLREAAAELARLEAAAQRLGARACMLGSSQCCETRDCAHWAEGFPARCKLLRREPGSGYIVGECQFDLKQGEDADENHD